jgi:transcriptional regulator with XRE-family HTH domain
MIRLKVREQAQAKGFNMSTLSRASGVSFMTIKRIWNADKKPYDAHLSTLHRIAIALDVPTFFLFEELPDKENSQ